MKKVLLFGFLAAAVNTGFSQGTTQFSASITGSDQVPPNNTAWTAAGDFELLGSSLQCVVTAQYPSLATDVTINGPATGGTVAAILFDIPLASINIPNPSLGRIGDINFAGSFTLTQTQISDISSGKWYVNVTSSTFSFVNGELRGQIVPVPEPSSLVLVGLGIAVLVNRLGKRDSKRVGK